MICIDGKKVKKCFLGDETIGKVYLGDDLIFQKASRLPAGYTELQYIENPELTYIDMRSYLSYTVQSSWEMIFELLDINVDCELIGQSQYTSATKYSYNYLRYTASSKTVEFRNYVKYGSSSAGGNTLSFNSGTEKQTFSFDKSAKLATLNNLSKIPVITGSSGFNCLFARGGQSGSSALTGSNFRLYSFKTLYNDMSTFAEFVPAIRDSDGKVGLYALLANNNNAFLTSYVTSKNFSAGPKA